MFATKQETRIDPLASDMFADRYITNKSLLRSDLALFETKWFDYRTLTPTEATFEYIDAYEIAFENTFAREIDRSNAEFVKPVTRERVLRLLEENSSNMRRTFAGLWRGRQVADAIGMPYQTYLELAFSFRMRNWGRRAMPHATQLYRDVEVEKIVARWEELQKSRLFIAEDSIFHNDNYENLPMQNAHHEWVFKQAQFRNNPPMTLAHFVKDGYILEQKVASRLPDYLCQKFKEYLV